MSADEDDQATSVRAPRASACSACRARSALLAVLSARIDHAARDADRLLDLLCLDDMQLIDAIGGRRRQELRTRYAALRNDAERPPAMAAICRHHPLIRRCFGARHAPLEPAALNVHGQLRLLEGILDSPLVAIVGIERASDYGMEMAASLAGALASAGVSVASGFGGGIPAAVHHGTMKAGGAPLAVMSCGADVCQPSCMQGLHRAIAAHGVAISELPAGFRARRWSRRAAERIIALLAHLVIVAESDGPEGTGMLAARLANARGAAVGALPGRVTSPGARGPHSLLRQGASLVASPQDALDLLYGVRAPAPIDPLAQLDPSQLAAIELVGGGVDTLSSLQGTPRRGSFLIALSELRSKGLLALGDDGHYLPRVSLDQARTHRKR